MFIEQENRKAEKDMAKELKQVEEDLQSEAEGGSEEGELDVSDEEESLLFGRTAREAEQVEKHGTLKADCTGTLIAEETHEEGTNRRQVKGTSCIGVRQSSQISACCNIREDSMILPARKKS